MFTNLFQSWKERVALWLSLNLPPFRMRIGKLGIWLMKVGRVLQIRYANWNDEFRLKHQWYPLNPRVCTIHVSDRVTTRMILTFESVDYQSREMTPMVQELFGIKGVKKIVLVPYSIDIEKGNVFNWGEILPKIDETIVMHLTKKT